MMRFMLRRRRDVTVFIVHSEAGPVRIAVLPPVKPALKDAEPAKPSRKAACSGDYAQEQGYIGR